MLQSIDHLKSEDICNGGLSSLQVIFILFFISLELFGCAKQDFITYIFSFKKHLSTKNYPTRFMKKMQIILNLVPSFHCQSNIFILLYFQVHSISYIIAIWHCTLWMVHLSRYMVSGGSACALALDHLLSCLANVTIVASGRLWEV